VKEEKSSVKEKKKPPRGKRRERLGRRILTQKKRNSRPIQGGRSKTTVTTKWERKKGHPEKGIGLAETLCWYEKPLPGSHRNLARTPEGKGRRTARRKEGNP